LVKFLMLEVERAKSSAAVLAGRNEGQCGANSLRSAADGRERVVSGEWGMERSEGRVFSPHSPTTLAVYRESLQLKIVGGSVELPKGLAVLGP